MYKIWKCPQQVSVVRFASTQQQTDFRQHSTSIVKVHLPFSNQSHIFFLILLFRCPLLPPFCSLAISLKIYFSQNMTVFPPRHMTISANTTCHRQLINGCTQTQHGSLCPSHLPSGTMSHFHTVLLALHNFYGQPLSAL